MPRSGASRPACGSRGVLLGIGLAAFIDKAGTGPSANLAKRGGLHGGWESAIVRVHSDGKVTLFAGSHSHGQGHEITFCQIAADRLGLPIEDMRLVEGDTDQIPFGNGTWGARSASVAGTAIYRAAGKVVDKARRFAAQLLECAEGDVDYGPRHFHSAGHRPGGCVRRGGRRGLSRRGAAARAARPVSKSPSSMIRPIPTIRRPFISPWSPSMPETGAVQLRALYAADDCGVVINPMIVEGQVHGGLAQGIGQALTERIVYDRASGQLLTASFLDYGMPRASDLPAFHTTFIATPAPSNPLGVKGASESGAIGAPAAIGNAVIDALWHLGVRDITLPITSETVWRALRERGGRADNCHRSVRPTTIAYRLQSGRRHEREAV